MKLHMGKRGISNQNTFLHDTCSMISISYSSKVSICPFGTQNTRRSALICTDAMRRAQARAEIYAVGYGLPMLKMPGHTASSGMSGKWPGSYVIGQIGLPVRPSWIIMP